MERPSKVAWPHRLTVRLTCGVILALLLIGVPFLFAFHRHLRRQQVESLSRATTALSQVIVSGLESSMLNDEPHRFDDVVQRLTRQAVVERVLIIDHRGLVRVSSDPQFVARVLDRNHDEPCLACHLQPGSPPVDSRTTVKSSDGGRIFRSMTLIPNRAECHRCHDPAQVTNGILLMDLSLAGSNGTFFANIGGTAALGSVMVLITIGALVFLLRRLVHEPLEAVVTASRKIVEGDLAARAEVGSPGEFGVLADRVNRMTHHLAQSLERVEDQRHQLQEILEAVDDEIVVLDRNRRIVAANRAFRESSGGSTAVEGQLCREVSSDRFPCPQDESSCPVQEVFQSAAHHKGIVSRSRPDGRDQIVEIHASPVIGPDGSVLQVVEVRRDITERRRMEASLAQSERLASLGLLASGISHELNNPLGAISASVEGLRRRLNSADESTSMTGGLDRSLALISDQVERGRAITDRLLRVARPPGGSRSLVDVNAILEDTLAILGHHIKRAGVEVKRGLAKGLPPIRCDPSALGQVLMNLSLNAIQAMEETGGEIAVGTSVVDGFLRIEIRDTGSGIPPAQQQRVFEPFFTTKPPGKGTGLGLFISHRLVTEMGGSIGLTSATGKGTVFTLTLPACRAEAAS